MYPNKKAEYKIYILPHRLKWYQKILQKLHIKNYYKELKPLKEIPDIEHSINELKKEKYPIKYIKYFRKADKND